MVASQVGRTAPVVWQANRGGQSLFVCCRFWEVLADGDRGGGKTSALLACFLAYVGMGFGTDWRGVIFRLTYPQLKDVIDTSRKVIPQAFPDARYNRSEHEWEFEGGEKLMFRHLENLKAYDHYHGHSYPFLGFEELCNWPNSEAYEAMMSCSRLRSANSAVPRMVRATTNSWGVGHSWVKARFIDGKQPFKPYGEPGRERARIPIRWRENTPFVGADPDYHVRLAETITSESQRKAWLESSWDIVAGGRFSDVWSEGIHYIEPFPIPGGWVVDRSHDWGSSKPFCTLWYAESDGNPLEDGRVWPKGTLFVIREDYGCEGDMNDHNWKPDVGLRLTAEQIADRVKMHEKDMIEYALIQKQPRPGPGDDPLFDTTRGKSMASRMASKGVVWLRPAKGPGSRVSGWDMIEQRLLASTKWPMEEPGLFVFNTCRHLRRTLPILPRDDKKPDDIISSSEDHCFKGETLVRTLDGDKKISDLVGTDGYVMTMDGWQYYYNCRMTRTRQPLVKIIFDDGSEIECTYDHKILTSKGWIQAIDLLGYSCYHVNSINKEGSWKQELLARRYKSLMVSGITCVGSISRARGRDYIGQYGNIISERYRRDPIFIIEMATGKTMMLAICKSWIRANISRFMAIKESTMRLASRLEMLLLNGMAAKKAATGTKTILERQPDLYGLKRSKKFAFIATRSMKPRAMHLGDQSSVLVSASREMQGILGGCTSTNRVFHANQNLGLTDTAKDRNVSHASDLRLARVVSVIKTNHDDVYCLTVPSVGHFCLSSGLVVKNCVDALRIKILSYGTGKVKRGVTL